MFCLKLEINKVSRHKVTPICFFLLMDEKFMNFLDNNLFHKILLLQMLCQSTKVKMFFKLPLNDSIYDYLVHERNFMKDKSTNIKKKLIKPSKVPF